MTPNGQAARATRTRQALLRAAGEMLERDGLDAVTLRALGAAAGVSRGAAYRHFTGKDELLAAVAARWMRGLHEAMTAAGAGRSTEGPGAGKGGDGGPLGRLEGMLGAYLDAALAGPAHYRLVFGGDLDAHDHPELAAEAGAAHGALLRAVTDAQAAGALPAAVPPASLAALLWSTAHGLADLLVSGHGVPEKGLDDPRAVIRLLLASVGGSGGGDGRRNP